ncbi:MAG: TIGR03663 family protein, partial [Anaerolineae bacterium]|nr:TIGR03663 family protein [Anaerolineae bacterium]
MATREQTFAATDSHEPALTRVLIRAYAVNWEVVAYAVIFALALITRLVELGVRVMSHDESLHTYYSWRLYEFGEFNHTPLMHGPLLFHMTALSYFLFGDSDFTARLYPALLGVVIVMMPLIFRRWLGRTGALITAVLLLISPQILYYSRYIRHDIPTMFFALLMLYAILQYIDGKRPRQAVWIWVIAAALLGMLASKEVAFIYIALFGSFMTLFWLLRMVQDIGITRRPGTASGHAAGWHAPVLQRLIGHALLLALVAGVVVTMGGFLRYLMSPILWTPTDLWFDAPLFLLLYGPLATWGFWHRSGPASAIMGALSNGKSSLYIIVAGAILGVTIALLIVCVIDIIKPDQVWLQESVLSINDQTYGTNVSKEFATAVEFDRTMFVRLLTWVGLPVLGLLFAVFLTAVFVFPGHLPLPWREILLILLIAFVAASVLVMFERRSFVHEGGTGPFAADPNAVTETSDDGYKNEFIWASWLVGVVIAGGVWGTRLFTNWWEFLDRQPMFDILIVLGTLIVPWLAAFPLYWAGYNLEDYNPNSIEGRDTLQASLSAIIPFTLMAISVGTAWNWKRWIPSAAIFLGLFAFFFTTVFSNQYGLATGMIGSLGYWLEQQGVRRGSQPQYYYMLTQLPVYEFLPMIGAMLASLYGLVKLWAWRRARVLIAHEEAISEFDAEWDARYGDPDDFEDSGTVDARLNESDPLQMGVQTVISLDRSTAISRPPDLTDIPVPPEPPDEPDPSLVPLEDEEEFEKPKRKPKQEPFFGVELPQFFPLPERLTRPFSVQEEQARRVSDPEWIGAFPFLALVGYWAITIIFGLTLAGEKMPWLTVHLALPLILVTGWWLGRVADGIRWDRLKEGGWLLLLVALPLAFMAFAQVVLGLWGKGAPFQGREIEDLTASGTWLSAVLILSGALYVVGRFGRRLGLAQIGRMTVLAGALILAILTARAAVWAAFINYDYATEYLVYAHAGPAIKTVLAEVDRIAELTNEGSQMRVVFDDESSWPYSWYFRDYPNYALLRGEAGSVNATDLEGARVVIVGNKKVGDVRRILGDRYYEFGYIRLWWPMQEYFNLNYNRVANVFSLSDSNIAARYYREGLFDIWFSRDYSTYAQAMCIDAKQFRCDDEAEWGTTPDEKKQFRLACEAAVISECRSDDRFSVNKWPVSDRMYFFVDKAIAAQIWDAGIGSSTVDIREPEYPEDQVAVEVAPEMVIGENLGLVNPRGIAVDGDGLIYVADTDRNRIVVFTTEGQELLSIGGIGGIGGPDLLLQPWGVAVGADGLIYVADTWHHQVKVFNAAGELVNAWGHEGVTPGDGSPDAFWGPREVGVGPDGLVYVADTGNKRVRVYTADGELIRDLGGAGANLGQLDEPVGLAFNPVSLHLYVAEAWNKRVSVFDANGLALRTIPVNMWFHNRESFNRPYLAVSPDGTLVYVTDMDDQVRIVAYNLNGLPVMAMSVPADLETGSTGFGSPAGIAFDTAGRLYVVDADQGRVYVFPPSEVRGEIEPVPPGGVYVPPVESGESGAAGETDSGEADQPPDDQPADTAEEAGSEPTGAEIEDQSEDSPEAPPDIDLADLT